MDLNELTPELFEKAEFTERRRGYDIDQVERFLEETGTAVAQLLVRYRQLEERAAHAESRLAEAEARLADARAAEPATPARSAISESDEVERATSMLAMARKTADDTIAGAEAEASSARADGRAAAERIVAKARGEAESELAAGRDRVLEVVTALETRRDELSGVIGQFEHRISSYREQLREVADALVDMVDDPEALGERQAIDVPERATGHSSAPSSPGAEARVDLTGATGVHDTASAAKDSGTWSEGSWASVSAREVPAGTGSAGAGSMQARTIGSGSSDATSGPPSTETSPARAEPDAVPGVPAAEPRVVVDAEPVTGQTSDRFLRELDEAVNESARPTGEDAMSAFFEGGEEAGRSRFGWRR